MKKRVLSFALALCFVFTLLPAAFADSETADGTVGDNITWTFDNGTLTISGSGEMDDCTWDAPWKELSDPITKVVIEKGVTSIGAGAFSCCTELKTVALPEGLEKIDAQAFLTCTALESVTLPESLKSIGYSAFSNCKSLKSISVPSGVTEIGNDAFAYCTGLESINAAAENGAYSSENGVLFNKEKTALITYPAGKTDAAYTIPSGVITVSGSAFLAGKFKSVTIPDGVKLIGYGAFTECENLESITIPDSVINVSDYAFSQCTALTTATMPSGVSKISCGTFFDCTKLKNVTIPTSVQIIDDKAFSICTSLSDIYYGGTMAQWQEMTVGTDNDALKSATIHYTEQHTHNYTTKVTAPTCTEDGYTTHTCACGYSYKDCYTKALGHSYKNGKCTRCGAVDASFRPAAPALKITTVSGKPQIYWNAVDGAVKYWVYRSTDGKNFKKYDTTTKTSYTNKSTTIGTTYYYKVKAVNANNAASDYSVTKGIQCKPAAPSASIYRTNGKPQLKWNAVTGATKYWIYRSTDGVNFKYYDSTTKLSYTNSGAASGTKYYYRVKAVAVVNGKNVGSANSSTKSLMTSLAKPSVSITTSNGKPKLTWKAVTGADKYYIYRSTDGKNFSFFDSTTKTSYTNTGAKKNTKYYYKVKAVCASNSYANSAQSSAVSIKATK